MFNAPNGSAGLLQEKKSRTTWTPWYYENMRIFLVNSTLSWIQVRPPTLPSKLCRALQPCDDAARIQVRALRLPTQHWLGCYSTPREGNTLEAETARGGWSNFAHGQHLTAQAETARGGTPPRLLEDRCAAGGWLGPGSDEHGGWLGPGSDRF